MGIAHLDRDAEAHPLHLVERSVNDWTHPVHHAFEEVHEVCDRVGVRLQLHVLDEPIERHLSVKFCQGDGALWACAGRGADADAGGW